MNVQSHIDRRLYSDNIPRPEEKLKNFYLEDHNIQYLMRRYLPEHMHDWAHQELTRFGERVAGPIDERAAYTDREGKPVLKKYNRLGEDISEIWKNEGYKQTAREVYGDGIVSYLYHAPEELGEKVPYLYSYLMGYLLSESEPGFYCPVTLTMSCAYLVDRYADPELKQRYLPGLTTTDGEKVYEGATWLTERQGGSDVGANLTVARYDEQAGVYRLTGEKFFASNAGAMVATVLARVNDKPGTKGLGLFLVPWIKPNGERNSIYVRRLKDKLGVNAVPSAEVILEEAEGYLIGEAEKGFKYMAEALNISRICNAVASVGILRRAFAEALYYTTHRQAFGQPVIRYSMVKEMLVDMLVDLEVTTGAIFQMINYFDQVVTSQDASREEQVMARLLIPLLKYRAGEVAVKGCHTSIELHGGNGYIEEYVTPRLLRDAQVTTVWEGTSNILALDLLRVIQKERGHEVFFQVVQEELELLSHSASQPFKPVIQNALSDIQTVLQKLNSLDYDRLTYKLKPLANLMIDVYLLLQIVKEAEDQAGNEGSLRKFIVAELFKDKAFGTPRKRNLCTEYHLDLDHFEALVHYGKVSRLD
ncbi:alkylation response protein AidB-like acyl-CoA dehydrogenase [Caldalkalibacillus uzonensis]|uniref:Alkylation response protein AidB-like acyl-CoA dehydrogenase n=2 Tax=Caldalkalibacillus uzonensis TaxID=353224 RepID=A0ABU0CP74_9BACI|nr:alkylation response protein AidB-like acyl-CoA dehydrogenase [Caldalkalibacillus uzonensis]